ncbi:MAG: hypothetical protein KZQ72_03120 [Candidatus Thiodiazotropha sp. (ex Cardiolucina cf. quadrata)]|nr:hypothetical protein [Candidatus Thiodiazotropha sp. (ex Cardiolucina cf. quadrata)]
MLITQSPSNATIKELIFLSSEGAAKWIEDKETCDIFYWPSDTANHEQIAEILHISEYDKGIAIKDRGPDLYDQAPEVKVRHFQVREVLKWMAAFFKKHTECYRNWNNLLDKNIPQLLWSRVRNKFRGLQQYIQWKFSYLYHEISNVFLNQIK